MDKFTLDIETATRILRFIGERTYDNYPHLESALAVSCYHALGKETLAMPELWRELYEFGINNKLIAPRGKKSPYYINVKPL